MQRRIFHYERNPIENGKLSKAFSNDGSMQHVLKNIDLELYKGDFTVIMGDSGAGKSTLLYALSGMDTPTLGTSPSGNAPFPACPRRLWRCSGGSTAAMSSSRSVSSTA